MYWEGKDHFRSAPEASETNWQKWQTIAWIFISIPTILFIIWQRGVGEEFFYELEKKTLFHVMEMGKQGSQRRAKD